MKKLLILISFLVLVPISTFAQEQSPPQTKNLKITMIGIVQHKEFEELMNGIKRIVGISNLVVISESKGRLSLAARFMGDPDILSNDMQALVMDRYKFDKKDRKETIEISLKKL